MKLSVTETATVLGKSSRQIRYLIRQGHVRATKVGKSWQIESDSLPLDEKTRKSLQQRLHSAQTHIHAALEPVAKAIDADESDTGPTKAPQNEFCGYPCLVPSALPGRTADSVRRVY